MNTRETCQCGRPLIARPGELEPTCGECHGKPDYCGCTPILPPFERLLAELPEADDRGRRERVHQVIRLLAGAPVQVQQEYRDAIVGAKYIKAADWKEALAEAKRDLSRSQPASEKPDSGPADALDITDEPDAVQQITAAINGGALPGVYLRGRQLVHVGVADDYVVTRDFDEPLLRWLIANHLACVALTKIGVRGALPQPKTCAVILAGIDWPKVPKLNGVASYPLLLPDGSVLQQPGYDPASGLFLHQRVNIEPISDHPSPGEIANSLGFLRDKYLRDFPWASEADLANYLAALLTPPLREIIADQFPLVYVTAPERGTGKSLLTELLTILYGGAIRTFPHKNEEMEKVITSTLRGAKPVIVFDNVEGVIKSAPLAAVLTTRMWTGRILGGSRDGEWPNDRLWMLTGTNVTVGGDFAQRSVRVAIDYGKPDPDQRIAFAIPDIARWTEANRGKVIHAVLTLARAWQVAGAPRSDHVMRGFTNWARVIGGILAYHQVPGFLANRGEIRVHDEDYAEWAHFLRTLDSFYPGRSVLTRTILEDAAADRHLGEAMPSTTEGGAAWTTRALGKALAAHAGRWYDGLSLSAENDMHAGVQRWKIRKVDG